MGGRQCAKEIIDSMNRMNAALQCMAATIVLSEDKQPTQEQADKFHKMARELAKYGSEIEASVGEGGGYGG